MVFQNTFPNFDKTNNVLKILSTYTVSGVQTVDLKTVTIPVGHLDASQLLSYLNTPGTCGRTDSNGYVYGFGCDAASFNIGAGAENYSYADAFSWDISESKLLYYAPLINNLNHVNNVAHRYTGFYLVYDTDTRGFLESSGILEYTSGTPANVQNVIIGGVTYGVVSIASSLMDFQVAYNGTVYTYPNNSRSYSPYDLTPNALCTSKAYNIIDLGSVSSLIVGWPLVNGASINSADNMSTSDTIANIPVLPSYGSKYAAQPITPYTFTLANFQESEFTLTVRRSDNGKYVDFQGVDWEVDFQIDYPEVSDNQPYLNAGYPGQVQAADFGPSAKRARVNV